MKSSETPIPTRCDKCSSKHIHWIPSSELPNRVRVEGYWWHCTDCDATVRCHGNTKHPMGKMADAHIRLLRHKAHLAFDPIWKLRLMSRDNAYAWLAQELDIHIEECGFGTMNLQLLKKSIQLADAKLVELRRAKRRQLRKHDSVRRVLHAEYVYKKIRKKKK